jgi:hypothetical protein
MNDQTMSLELLEDRVRRREDRREFFRAFAGIAAAGGAASALTGTAFAQTAAPTDADILNFALNLEYLEAQFYTFAVFGQGLPADLLSGTGTRGDATGGRAVNFTDPIVRQYAVEIAQDERAHVRFLRTALGSAAVAQPAIDISAGPNGPFSNAARAAGLIGPGQAFDPYASDEAFLLGAFIFEDVGVTAYKGASPLIANLDTLEAAAGLLAVEAYHAALVRTVLFRKGIDMPTSGLIEATESISNARDSLDGPTNLDMGIRPMPTRFGEGSNIFPSDADGIAFSRTPGQVLNIVYLNRMAVTAGGFFPNGVNGTLRTSGAN